VDLNKGSALYIFSKLHFSGLRFDSTRKTTIGCMYQFDICNNFIYFENFDYLNIHEILENVCYWQEISIYSILVGFILTFKYLLNYYNGMVLPTKFNMTSKVRLP
jgi:hypothetical protein